MLFLKFSKPNAHSASMDGFPTRIPAPASSAVVSRHVAGVAAQCGGGQGAKAPLTQHDVQRLADRDILVVGGVGALDDIRQSSVEHHFLDPFRAISRFPTAILAEPCHRLMSDAAAFNITSRRNVTPCDKSCHKFDMDGIRMRSGSIPDLE